LKIVTSCESAANHINQDLPTSAEALSANNIVKSFPGVFALDQVSIGLLRGEVHALIGENGAGKSTLLKILSGIIQPDQGEILLEGKRTRLSSALTAQKRGIGIVFQELNLVPTLDVATNIFLGHEPHARGLFSDRKKIEIESQRVLDSLGITVAPTSLVGDLSIAQVQTIAIARALSFDLKVLLLDEPTSSLSSGEIKKLYEAISSLKSQGVGVLYVSHRLEEIFEIADRVTVLRDGKRVDTKPTSETSMDEIITKMVGRTIVHMYPKSTVTSGQETLRTQNISKKNAVNNINIYLRQSEVVGLFGLVGAGRTELARIIFGLDSADEGEVYLWNESIAERSPKSMISHGLGYLSEDRHREGLCDVLSIRQNIVRASLASISKWGMKALGQERKLAGKYVEELGIVAPSMERHVGSLSGGTQQKVVFAHWMCAQCKILILDEPTRGIDVGTKVEIYKTINRLVEAGMSILLISSDLPEVTNMSDRLYVMYRGSITATFRRGEADSERIIACAIGVGETT
jgi:ABC-type sugar transport system ATPase subunit